MKRPWRLLGATVPLLASSPPSARPPPAPVELEAVDPSRLQVESGTVEPGGKGRFTLPKAVSRALVPGSSGAAARLRFTYRGPSQETAPLASGELRRQIGLKLLAHDTCNLLYVMWHLEPKQELSVQLKRNEGAHTHKECGDRGYVKVRGELTGSLPRIEPGQPHELAAFVEGARLRVELDGQATWEGALPADALELEGPAGLRSDNGEFEVTLWAQPAGKGQR
jgi:hypothetical protein